MPNMTLAIPDDLHRFIKRHREINWSEVARQAMRNQADKLELLESITRKSKFTAKDAEILDKKIKKGLFKKLS